jgi:hypothetical protein
MVWPEKDPRHGTNPDGPGALQRRRLSAQVLRGWLPATADLFESEATLGGSCDVSAKDKRSLLSFRLRTLRRCGKFPTVSLPARINYMS